MTRPRPLVPRLGATLALAALAAAALPAAASAKPTGATKIELKGAAATALAAQNVRISAQKPAQANARRIVLPVIGGTVTGGATLRNGGSVSFRTRIGRRTRTVRLTGWQTQVGSGGSSVSATLSKRRLTFFTIAAPKRRVALDRSSKTARVTGGSVRLTSAGAKALRNGLALRTLSAGPLGSATVAARLDGGSDTGRSPTTPGGGGSTPGTPTTPGPTTPTPRTPSTPDECAGFDSTGAPVASTPLAPTAGARPVTAADFRWYPRDSWIQYLAQAQGASAVDGATDGPLEAYPTPSDARLVYSWRFPFTPSPASWYDATAGKGVISFTGGVRFLFTGHGIDLTLRNPEIELNGASSRVVFNASGAACSKLNAQRVEVLTLALRAPAGPAPTFTFPTLNATLTDPGAKVFGDAYFPGTEWGSLQGLTVTAP